MSLYLILIFFSGFYSAGNQKLQNYNQQIQGKTGAQIQSYSQSVVANKENTVNNMYSQWRSCVSRCVSQHSKTEGECNVQFCSSEKSNYERYKQELDKMKKAQADLQKKEQNIKNKSALQQVQDQKKKTNLYALVGVGTTAFLGYKAKMCCAQCTGLNPACCGMCPVWVGMTGLAAAQTVQMFKKKNELQQTAFDLCATSNCNPGDLGDTLKDPKMTNIPDCKLYPALCDTKLYDPDLNNPGMAKLQAVEPIKTTLPNSNLFGSNPTFPANPALSKILADEVTPKTGWPNGQNPLKKGSGFSYEDLTPQQKAKLDASMKDFNNRKQAFLSKNGLLNSDSRGLAEALETEEESLDVAGDFSDLPEDEDPVLDGSSALAGNSDRSLSTADKIKDMLKNMSKGSQSGLSSLADKSVSVGNDSVGVREDNIFIMVHRMNRKLDEEESYFIKDF